LLAELRPGPLGALGVLGNHDYGYRYHDHRGADRLVGLLRELDITILRNEVLEIDGLQFVGIDDLWGTNSNPRRALRDLDRSKPSLVLCHNPDGADLPIWGGYAGWMLSGHTHGGQVKPPFLPAPVLPTKNKRYIAGDYDVGPDRKLYINRGVGHLLPVRFNARPEVTIHTLVAA
jgi:predicted MPP superfamily phosphohydrolase